MPDVAVIRRDGYAVLSLQKRPVNSLNTSFWTELQAGFDSVASDASMRGVIFSSGLSRNVFTAGNDINELYAPRTSKTQYRHFWVLSNHFLAQVYTSRLVTVCAIKGACPAGGCCLALCCDFRVMTEQGHIGLNEVALGIPVPLYWSRVMAAVIGPGQAERLCKNAALLSPRKALEIGLVDTLVESEAALLPAAEAYLQSALRFPDFGRLTTKHQFRSELAEAWRAHATEEPEGAWDMLCSPAVKGALERYLSSLGSKKSKL